MSGILAPETLTDEQILQAARDGILPRAAALICINALDGDSMRYRQRICNVINARAVRS